MREPDFVIGPKADPYLRRWWVIPRNRWFNIYLHEILKSDDDRALHDHPWWNVSIILKGGYWEVLPDGLAHWRKPRSMTFRRPTALHRLIVNSDAGAAWTLFITGPRVREWGFACPNGWRVWTEFVSARDKGEVGRGCD